MQLHILYKCGHLHCTWLMCKGGQPCGCVPEAVWVHVAEQGVCPCANTSEHAQCEHIWAYEEGEVFQVWQPHTAACAQVPTRARSHCRALPCV